MDNSGFIATIIGNPFWRGLLIGGIVCLIIWIRSLLRIRTLNREIKKLREHLHTKLEIDSEENERRKKELERIRQERDNLRNMVQVLNQKPGKQEIRQSHIYQKAVDIMFEKTPGFAPVWQITLKEAEEEMKNAERGIIPFFKRMKSPPSVSSTDTDRKKSGQLELEEPASS